MLYRNLKSTADQYRMLVTDLDGTLLTSEKSITPDDRAAIVALRAIGVHVTIATGRLYSAAAPIADALEIDDLIACMNGSDLIDHRDGQSRFSRFLPVAERARMRERLRESSIETLLFASRSIHHGSSAREIIDRFRSWSGEFDDVGDVFASPIWDDDNDVLAVVGHGRRDEIFAIGDDLRGCLGDEREVFTMPSLRDDTGLLMIRDRREDKGTALRALAADRAIKESEVVCVGDWVNDLPMLQSQALSFSMGGTARWLGRAADHELDARRDAGGAIAEIARRVWGVAV